MPTVYRIGYTQVEPVWNFGDDLSAPPAYYRSTNLYRTFGTDDLERAFASLDRLVRRRCGEELARAVVRWVWRRENDNRQWSMRLCHDNCEAQADSPTPPATGQSGTPDFPRDFPTRPDMTQSGGDSMTLKQAKVEALKQALMMPDDSCLIIRRVRRRQFVVERGPGQRGDGTVMIVHPKWVREGWYDERLGKEQR